MEQLTLEQIEKKILWHRKQVFDQYTGDFHCEEVVKLQNHPIWLAEQNRRLEELRHKHSERMLFLTE